MAEKGLNCGINKSLIMTTKITVPDIGDFENVEIIEILVKPGDTIKKNDPVVTLESDKSSVEVPSTVEGKISNINVKVGDKVSKGDLILEIEGNGKSSPDEIKKSDIPIPKSTKNLIEEAEKTIQKEIPESLKEVKKDHEIVVEKEKIKKCIEISGLSDFIADEITKIVVL